MERFEQYHVEFQEPFRCFDERVISFSDPDSSRLELVAETGTDRRPGWKDGVVPVEFAIRGLHLVTLLEERIGGTQSLLTETLRFRLVKSEGNRSRYEAKTGGTGAIVDVILSPETPPAFQGAGMFHHIAWRTQDDAQQKAWRGKIASLGLNVTPIIDRK